MNQIRKYYLPGFLLLVILYLYFSYSRERNTQQAYLYDPNSDDIYIVELVQELDEFNKYSFLNPFKNCVDGINCAMFAIASGNASVGQVNPLSIKAGVEITIKSSVAFN